MFHLRRHRRTSGEVDKSKNLHDKTSHLYEISKAPKDTWQILADTAYMELVKANNQGELLAIEYGHHFNQIGEKAQGKKGGGMQAYADAIGKPVKFIEMNSKADEVRSSLPKSTSEVNEKTTHLYEISKAPQHTWQILADLLIKCDWSVKDTQAAVNRVKSINLLDWMKADFKEIATTPAIVLSLSM